MLKIIYFNIMNLKEVKLAYNEKTTVQDLVLTLKPEDFGGIEFSNFKDALLNQTLVTHGDTVVDNDVVIFNNFKLGERFFVQLKINFERNIEHLVYDKTMALDMLYHLNSIQNDNDYNQIQRVL